MNRRALQAAGLTMLAYAIAYTIATLYFFGAGVLTFVHDYSRGSFLARFYVEVLILLTPAVLGLAALRLQHTFLRRTLGLIRTNWYYFELVHVLVLVGGGFILGAHLRQYDLMPFVFALAGMWLSACISALLASQSAVRQPNGKKT